MTEPGFTSPLGLGSALNIAGIGRVSGRGDIARDANVHRDALRRLAFGYAMRILAASGVTPQGSLAVVSRLRQRAGGFLAAVVPS